MSVELLEESSYEDTMIAVIQLFAARGRALRAAREQEDSEPTQQADSRIELESIKDPYFDARLPDGIDH